MVLKPPRLFEVGLGYWSKLKPKSKSPEELNQGHSSIPDSRKTMMQSGIEMEIINYYTEKLMDEIEARNEEMQSVDEK